MTSGLQPELLNEKQKRWLATAICGAVTADGSIAPEEVEYLERALGFLRSQTEVNTMLQAVKDQKLPPLERIPEATREMEIQIWRINQKIILVLSVIKLGLGVKYITMTMPKMNALENTERCLIRTETTLSF